MARTGLAVAIPPGFYGRVAPRSGLAAKNGLDVLAGVIDVASHRVETPEEVAAIGRWALEEACRQMREWQRLSFDNRLLTISVNLSAKQLMHPALRGQVEELAARRDRGSVGTFHPTTVKIMCDGVLENYTGAMLDPYLDGAVIEITPDAADAEEGRRRQPGGRGVSPLRRGRFAALDGRGVPT